MNARDLELLRKAFFWTAMIASGVGLLLFIIDIFTINCHDKCGTVIAIG